MRILALLLLAAVASAGPVTRGDVARAYLRFERAFASHPPADRGDFSLRFDRVAMEFLRGGMAPVVAGLDRLTVELEPDAVLAPGRFLRVEPELAGPEEPVRIRVESWRPDDRTWVVRVRDAKGEIRVEHPAGTIGPLPPGAYSVFLELPGGVRYEAGRFAHLAREPAAWRAELLSRCASVAGLDEARASFRARLALPGSDRTAALLADPLVLVSELEDEIAAIERGVDPYVRRTGDFWRVVRSGGYEIPTRFVASASADPLPLVIALHGAGGDENLWCFGYGAGRLAELARSRGFVLVTPSTYSLMASDRHLDALVEEAARCYPIDRDRVFLLGHSLGAITAFRLATLRDDLLAGAACIAGAIGGTPRVPVRIYAGALDPLVPAARLRAVAEPPVEYIEEKNEGHTLLVPAVLEDAVSWLLGRERTP